ncbi:MAG TPA: NTF2 fold immunity protein [Gemmataceae bacterium]|jgi:hypothetical protein|nr:NTF2 fold immunity protein [Gemmataceae bacterium]
MAMEGPDECVRRFIAAHASWNSNAASRARKACPGTAADDAAFALAEAEYDEMLSRLCAATVVRQGISFGDRATHDPTRESITEISESENRAVVRTRHVDPSDFVSKYEYHLVRESGEWRIASLLYIDDDGAYECL